MLRHVQPTAGEGQQQGLNTPPSGRADGYSSLPSKHKLMKQVEGFRVPPIPAAAGRTQPTPRASRSVGAELAGAAISIFGISCSNLFVVIFTGVNFFVEWGYYSSLPSKHIQIKMPPPGVGCGVPEGFRVPPITAAPGRTQPTPRASRSIGAELTGEFTSMLGITFSK